MAKLLQYGTNGYKFVDSSSGPLTVDSIYANAIKSQDSYILLNNGYVTSTPKFGGLVVIDSPSTTTTSVESGGFVAGVDGVSNPYIYVSSSVGFSAGDIIQVTESNVNDSLYEINSTSSGRIHLRGIGLNDLTVDFLNDQVTSTSEASGIVTIVRVSVLRSRLDGSWEGTSGSNTNPFIFSSLGITKAIRKTLTNLDTPYTVKASDEYIFINATNGNVLLYMPAIVTTGTTAKIYRFKRLDNSAYSVTINGSGYNIDGSSTYVFPGRYTSLSLVDNGIEWSMF